LTYTGNGQAIYLRCTTLITSRFNDYIHKNERYFWQETSPPRCSRVLHSVVIGMWGGTNYRRAVRNLMHDPQIYISRFRAKFYRSIIFRAFQGIGGSGIYSLAMASVLEITPLKYIGHTSAGVAMANACASILGPIVGGAITSGTTWRWVFWLKCEYYHRWKVHSS
jgi:Major Facilitator Superfamily